jgi:hypothetical protein
MSRPATLVVFALPALSRTLLLGAVFLAACATGGSGQVSGSVYAGVGFYDPWYWGPCCYDEPGVVVGPPPGGPPGGRPPPDGRPPVRPEQPIAKHSPSPRPAPMPRPAAGGRRR